MDNKALSETDIRTMFTTPAIVCEDSANWDLMTHIHEEVSFTNDRVIEGGKMGKRGEAKKTDCTFYQKLSIPPAAEKHRIVAKVDQLMALVDQREAQLEQSRFTATKFLNTLVAELNQKS